MKIELKNIKFFPSGSQETNCFTADVVIEGNKIGYAENSGHGGNTNVRLSHTGYRKLWEEAEAYCKALPAIPFDYGGDLKGEHKQDLESVVDGLFDEWLIEKENAKFFKKLDKYAVNCIVVYNPKELTWYKTVAKWNTYTIPELLKIPAGLIQVQNTVFAAVNKLENGEAIYNPALQDIIKMYKKPA